MVNLLNSPQEVKNFNLEKILICPQCEKKATVCNAENCSIWIRGNTPQILQLGELPFIKLIETETTNPYSEGILKVLNKIEENGIGFGFWPR